MQKLLAVPALALLLFAAACSDPTANYAKANTGDAVKAPAIVAAAEDKELKFSNDGSTLEFLGAKVTASHPGGFKTFTGKAIINEGTLKKVEVDIDTTTIWAGDTGEAKGHVNDRLTGHLKSADFFNVEKYPKARFETTKIVAGGEGGTHTITANLTIMETTKSIAFPATIKIEDGKLSAQAKFKINRSEWGIVYKGMADDLIKEEVGLEFNISAK